MVTETESEISLSDARSIFDKVVLPAPEGEDITNNRPRRSTAILEAFLLNVLNLLTHLVDHGFEVKANGRQAAIIGF